MKVFSLYNNKFYKAMFISKFKCNSKQDVTVFTKIVLVPKTVEYTEDVFWAFFLIYRVLPVTDKQSLYSSNKNKNGIRFHVGKSSIPQFLFDNTVIALPHCAVAVSASILTSNFVKYEIIDLSSYFVLGHFDEEISDVFSFYVLFYLNSLTKERSLFALSFYRNAC